MSCTVGGDTAQFPVETIIGTRDAADGAAVRPISTEEVATGQATFETEASTHVLESSRGKGIGVTLLRGLVADSEIPGNCTM